MLPWRTRKHLADDLTPEQREARMAELRTKRRARIRVLAIRSGIASTILLVVLAIALYWLVQTVAGRDVLLGQIIARLPEGSSFTWNKVEGPIAGPLTLHGVDFRYGKIHFTAERVYLDPDLRPLLGKRLRLDALQLTNATLDMPRSDEPFKLPTWPELLPQIEMPLDIQADTLEIDGLRITQSTQPLLDIQRARGGIDIGDGYFRAERLAIDSDRGRFNVHGGYAPRKNYLADVVVTAVFPATLGRTPARLGLVARGDRKRMDIGVGGNAPAPLRIVLGVRGEENPTWNFSGKTEALDLSLLGMGEAGTPLSFDLKADGAGGAADLHGRLAQGELAVVIEPSKIRIANEVLTVEPLAVQALDGRATLRGRADFANPDDPGFKFSVNARGLRWGEDEATRILADADLGIAGKLKDWAAIGKATLVREEQKATVDFDGRGDDQQIQLKQLLATMPTGTLDATGMVGWAPQLRWDIGARLAGFDPGYFLADWKGNV
ncbi:MAG: translocation/assembly module TamB, partial [Pseudoxanthomonas sp.]